MGTMNDTSRMGCDLISYKICEDALAEAFAVNGIADIAFESGIGGVRTVRGEDGIIFAHEGGEMTLPQLLFLAWSGADPKELGEEEKSLFSSMGCGANAEDLADCRSYRLETSYSGSREDKLRVIKELFDKTDISRRLDRTAIRVSEGGMETHFGVFGFEKISYTGGGISYMLLVPAGMGNSEDNAALLMKDGELTVSDRGDHIWEQDAIEEVMSALNELDAPMGLTVLKKMSCQRLERLTAIPAVLEIRDGALTDCTALREVVVLKPNILLGRGFVNEGTIVAGLEGSAAYRYARENGHSFRRLESDPPKPMRFAIAEGVCLTVDTMAVYRRQGDGRAMLNDVSFVPYEGGLDDFDCEMIDLSEERAGSSGLSAQLEGFGSMIDAETVRNDRSGYIKATMMRSAQRQDIFGYALEIEREGRRILLHAEKQFGEEELEKGAGKALFSRFKELGSSVEFGAAFCNAPAELPAFKVAEDMSEESVTSEMPAVEQITEEENVFGSAEEEEAIAEPVMENEIPTETAVEETVDEPVVEEEIPAETAVEETVIEPVEGDDPVVEAEMMGEQGTAPAEEIVDVAPEEIRPADDPAGHRLVRGERFDVSEYAQQILTVDMEYQSETGLDIDGYMFLLAADGKVRSDADLVFFGQKTSVDRAVNNDPANSRSFTVELSKLDGDISRLVAAFAIYGGSPEQNFSRVSKPIVRISCNGRELCSYEIDGLGEERSAVALELYNKGGWKLRTVGLGYKEGLKSLCGSYGVEVR